MQGLDPSLHTPKALWKVRTVLPASTQTWVPAACHPFRQLLKAPLRQPLGSSGGPPQKQTESLFLTDLKVDEKSSCTLPEGAKSSPQEIDPTKENQLYFTYSVHWEVRRG